jgi:nucleoid-associated protein YgaU
MQQIERYGVIVLVFFLVTIVAVSFWGDSKSPGFWARLTGKGQPTKEQNEAVAKNTLGDQHIVDPNAPLSPQTTPPPTVGGTMPLDGNTTTSADLPPYTPGPAVADVPQPGNNPFVPNAGTPIANPQPQAPIPHVDAPQAASVSYVVEKGDSLASIARHKLGAESRWTEIQALNNGVNPKNLRVGQTLVLPSGAATEGVILSANTHKPAPARTNETKKLVDTKKSTSPVSKAPPVAKETSKSGSYYTVRKGDGLRAIAREQLGDESRWKEIVAANPGLKPDHIYAGQRLRMPGSTAHATSSTAALASIQGRSNSDEPRVR